MPTSPAARAREVHKGETEIASAWEELSEAARGLPTELAGDKTALVQAVAGRQLHAMVEGLLREINERTGKSDVSPDSAERCRRFVAAAERLKGSSSHRARPK